MDGVSEERQGEEDPQQSQSLPHTGHVHLETPLM